MSSYVQLRGIYKRYPRLPQPVLKNLRLDLQRGDRLVILGESGAGKTTLLTLLGLLLKADQGQVLIEGEDAQNWDERRRARWRNQNLGYVFQDFGLIPELTLEENVNLPLRIAGISPRKFLGRELLAEVGLSGRESSFPSEVSGGESQRVAIARALVGRPKLVLADEPTGNLQREQGHEVGRLFHRLQEELGFTLVVATHNEGLISILKARSLRLACGVFHSV